MMMIVIVLFHPSDGHYLNPNNRNYDCNDSLLDPHSGIEPDEGLQEGINYQ